MSTSSPELAYESQDGADDFELLRDAILRANEGNNALDIEPTSIDKGEVHCVGSAVFAAELFTPDTFTAEDDGLIHRNRKYPGMIATAHLVALWPRCKEAALYSITTPFQVQPEGATTSFADTVNDLLTGEEVSDYRRYSRVDTVQDGAVLYGNTRSAIYERTLPRVLATPETNLSTNLLATDHIDNREKLELTLTGPAQVLVPGREYLQVTDTRIVGSPTEEFRVPVVVPSDFEPPLAADVVVAMGTIPSVDANGAILIPGKAPTGYAPDLYTHNPTISPEDTLRLIGSSLPLQDITEQFLVSANRQLRSQCVIDPSASWENIRRQALDALAEAQDTSRIFPKALGYVSVRQRIGEVVDELRNSRDLIPVTLARLELVTN